MRPTDLWPTDTRIIEVGATRLALNGHNISAGRSGIVAANGFDERMGYGCLDRELGERLKNAGVRGKLVRHPAVCGHLHHKRGL